MANIDLSFPVANGLSLDDLVGVFCGESDPSANSEVAPVGSLYLRHTGAFVGELWVKIGTADSAWAKTLTTQPSLSDVLGVGNTTSGNNIVITSGDQISGLVANGLTYPTSDGTTNQALITNGSGVLSFSSVTSLLGSVDNHTDVDTTTGAPVVGDTLKWNGTNWTPSSNGGSGSSSNNFIYAYDTTTQPFVTPNVLQLITFTNTPQIDGWVNNSSQFTAGVGGQYMTTIKINVEKAGGGQVTASMVARINGTNIPGSHNGMDITSNNTAFSLSRSFLFNCNQGDVLSFVIGGQTSQGRITPSPIITGIVTPISVTLTVRRLT